MMSGTSPRSPGSDSATSAQALVRELNTILQHMDVLSRVDTERVPEIDGVGMPCARRFARTGSADSARSAA